MSDFRLDLAAGVATLTLSRPAVRNALTLPMLDTMVETITGLHDRDDVNVLVLTGDGGHFCVGADLMANIGAIQGDLGIEGSVATFHRMLRAVWDFPRPTIAAVAGDAVGFGMDLALAFDLRIAADTVRFRHGFSRIALVPDGGSTMTLQRLVGTAKALEIMYFSDTIEADEALASGLVNRVVPAAELVDATAAWAGRLAQGPQKALRLSKELVRASMGVSMDDVLGREFAAQVSCLSGSDPMAGVAAWMNKTEPEFSER